jgi:hypothetical protein
MSQAPLRLRELSALAVSLDGKLFVRVRAKGSGRSVLLRELEGKDAALMRLRLADAIAEMLSRLDGTGATRPTSVRPGSSRIRK